MKKFILIGKWKEVSAVLKALAELEWEMCVLPMLWGQVIKLE